MPDENRNKRGGGTSPLAVAAAIGLGVVAAVGSYFYGREQGAREEREQVVRQPRREPMVQTHATDGASGVTSPRPDEDAKGDDFKECGICLRSFDSIKENHEEIHTTPCGHLFCKHCLSDALIRNEVCPYCRHPVKRDETLRVYL